MNERISWRATRIILLKTFLKNKLSSVASLASEDGLFNWKAFYEIWIQLNFVTFVHLTNTQAFPPRQVSSRSWKSCFLFDYLDLYETLEEYAIAKKVAWTANLNCLLKAVVS